MSVPAPESGLGVYATSSVVRQANTNRRHHHEFFEILCISEGETHVQIREQTVVAGAGDLLIYYPHEDHEETVQPGRFSIICLRFDPKACPQLVEFPDKTTTGPLVHLPWPERFQSLFGQMMIEQQMMDPFSRVMMRGYLTQFIVLLQRSLRCIAGAGVERVSDRSMRISKAIELIHAHLDTDVSLRDLAEQSYMSESHFSHTFRELTGISPKKYLIQARMRRAQELLVTSDLSIKTVASTVGYEDSHYFSRLFRRSTGQTPTAFRESQKAE